ncbi:MULTISPECIES: hypothetical protein [Streptosporangium]|uniref:CHASE2 domain-containing sensor protein n=1 Tax=Streptosporangium brasiliense TaxID=47480 RepID=A0ABT9R830_9ACTN|nr:hypothetical protein [Streptosporangium brasiliense]MDP9865393.1 CHASE2 domain-containing sensor protein [Streptosporangium brasiliense]
MSSVTGAARPPAAGGGGSDLLRTVLRIDGWSTAVFGVVMLAGSGPLSGPLGLPTTWSVPFGVAMLGGAAALGLIAGYPRIPPRHAASVVAGNALSCVALLLLTFADVIPLTGPGVAFMLVGALVVAVYAGLEFIGLRRSMSAGAREAMA